MLGMDCATGRRLEGIDHLHQSIKDILATPIGSRVMRRDYGSLLPDLLDQPLTEATLLQAYAACVIAISTWEPRLLITAVRRRLIASLPGQAVIEIEGLTRAGSPVQLEVPLP